MKLPKAILVFIFICFSGKSFSQEFDNSLTLSFFAGVINYQGDLNPNSFSFVHSNFAKGIIFKKPINRWFTFRAGVNIGKIEAADAWNRDYLKSRNLSFTTDIKEAYAGLDISLLDLTVKKISPYIYGGFSVFHFNPWSKDNNGIKTYLKPLSTEGQGLSQYPDQKPYRLTQFALAFGGGIKYAVSDAVFLGIEMSQRKSFTDYIDDVSSIYVDRNILYQEKGAKAVEMAYRGGLSPVGQPLYPPHGEQRGTPTEMDWYYFLGLNLEIKLNALGNIFQISRNVNNQRCPRSINKW